jgi:hypothetical protein
LGRFSAKDVNLPHENSTWRIFAQIGKSTPFSLKSTAARSLPNVAMLKARGFTPRTFKARA